MDCEITNNKPMKINQFKNKLRKRITSLKIGGTNKIQNKRQRKTPTYNTQTKPQRKTPTHTHQRSMYMRNQLKLRK